MSLRFLSRDSQWVRGQNQIMHRSIRKFIVAAPRPPPGNPRIFHRRPCPGGGKFEPYLDGVGNLTHGMHVF